MTFDRCRPVRIVFPFACYDHVSMPLRFCYVFLIFLASAWAEPKIVDFNRHGWYSYSGEHKVKGRWGIHFDAQWRRSNLITEWQQYQLRPGLNYSVNPNLLLTLGYAFTRTYPYGEFPIRAAMPEHRIYQQVLYRRGAFRHRIRMEQRWIDYPTGNPGYTYQNRFRYLVRTQKPLSENWYLPVYDEILIGIPPNYGFRPFDQNRIFAGVGRSTKYLNVEVGYLNQFLGQRNGRIFEFNNTLFVSFTPR